MAEHMVIAPGHPIDRTWWKRETYAVRFVPLKEPAPWYAADLIDPMETMPVPETATFRRLWHPGWKIVLGFYVHDALGQELPLGYAMPGWLHGVQMESRPWGIWKHDAAHHWWELTNGDPTGPHWHRVPCDVIRERPDLATRSLREMEVRPLPDEAFQGCPPRPPRPGPPWIPKSIEEVMRILDGE